MLNFLKPSYCDGCENPFPANALIGFFNDRYCCRCLQKLDKETYYCEGCGEPYPMHYLEYAEQYEAYFCSRCL